MMCKIYIFTYHTFSQYWQKQYQKQYFVKKCTITMKAFSNSYYLQYTLSFSFIDPFVTESLSSSSSITIVHGYADCSASIQDPSNDWTTTVVSENVRCLFVEFVCSGKHMTQANKTMNIFYFCVHTLVCSLLHFESSMQQNDDKWYFNDICLL